MKSPWHEFDRATIARAYHTQDQDSVRLEFDNQAELIGYNVSVVNGVDSLTSDPSCEFPMFKNKMVENISRDDDQLLLQMHGGCTVAIRLHERYWSGPEAFQLVLPGYPLIVAQNE